MGSDLNLNKVIIEGDAFSIIKKCTDKSIDRTEICAYIKNIKQFVSRFRIVSFQHVMRTGNMAAHRLNNFLCIFFSWK